jgi:hypothetical protein
MAGGKVLRFRYVRAVSHYFDVGHVHTTDHFQLKARIPGPNYPLPLLRHPNRYWEDCTKSFPTSGQIYQHSKDKCVQPK